MEKHEDFRYWLSAYVFDLNGLQRTGLNAIPAAQAEVIKNHGLFEKAVNLFKYLMGAGRRGRAFPFFRITFLGITFFIIHHGKRFFGL
jgi:hypothetical protein